MPNYRISGLKATVLLTTAFMSDLLKAGFTFILFFIPPFVGGFIFPIFYTAIVAPMFYAWLATSKVTMFDRWWKFIFWFIGLTPIPLANFIGMVLTILESWHRDKKKFKKAQNEEYEQL